MSRPPTTPGRRVQLHRAISKLRWGSRTVAWQWIRARQVRVDDCVVTDPLTWIDLNRQTVTLAYRPDERPLPRTLALHKPAGIITTRRDERSRPTVYDFLPAESPWVFPAGRLDADSEGLLVLTNDSALAVQLTDPDHRVPKTYQVTVDGVVSEESLHLLREGVELADGRTRPATTRILEASPGRTLLEVVLAEGRNRQVRRMLAARGHRVRRLVRVAIGAYLLGDLPPGEIRSLTPSDLAQLTAAESAPAVNRSGSPRGQSAQTPRSSPRASPAPRRG